MANKSVEDDDKPLELPIGGTRKVGTKKKNSKFNNSGTNRKQQNSETPIQSAHSEGPRDPRFDPRCSGSGEARHFIRNYAFLDEVRQREVNELQKALRKERDAEKRDKIKMTITRYRNKMIDKEQKLKTKKRGKHKKLELIEKFKDLKESGKLTKYLERKRKKLLKRDQRSFAG